jgi:toluene monooxygenase electron transfer component
VKTTTTISSNESIAGTMKITVQSKSGDVTFQCGDGETILHAGLRQGFRLPYECATGTCGTCRARVTSGDVEVRWKDAPGGARLKPEKGDVLMCQTRARSDCVLRVPSEIDASSILCPAPRRGVIRGIRSLTHDVTHFDIDLSKPISFEAGQFVVIEAGDLQGGRAYSMVNFDQTTDRIELVLKRKPGGGFSNWLVEERENVEVNVFGPLGRAVFRPQEEKHIVCIAGGSGIAGMMSILAHAVALDYFRDRKGSVFFGVRTLADTFYLDQLSSYVDASHGHLDVTVTLSDEAAAAAVHQEFPNLKLASGFVHEVATKTMNGRYGDAIAFVAGPPPMVDATIRGLIIGGMATKDIRYDKFA